MTGAQTVEPARDEDLFAASHAVTEGERGQRGLGRTASGCEDGDGPAVNGSSGWGVWQCCDDGACVEAVRGMCEDFETLDREGLRGGAPKKKKGVF